VQVGGVGGEKTERKGERERERESERDGERERASTAQHSTEHRQHSAVRVQGAFMCHKTFGISRSSFLPWPWPR